jgi:hypothetical protein
MAEDSIGSYSISRAFGFNPRIRGKYNRRPQNQNPSKEKPAKR